MQVQILLNQLGPNMQDKYGAEYDQVYCYPNSNVLRNRLNIHDQETLNSAEVEFSQFRLKEFNYANLSEFSLQTWRNIHFYLFQDIYEWAGEVRSVKISKGDTLFAMPGLIESYAPSIFAELEKEKFLCKLDRSKFIERIAFHFGELNLLHPFREGNGRSQRLLFELIALNAGYALDWTVVNGSDWVPANIAAVRGDVSPLISLFNEIVVKIPLSS